MTNDGTENRILKSVGEGRRDFVKRVLVGAPFAVPVVASFAIGSLDVDAALAQDNRSIRPNAINGATTTSGATTSGTSGPGGFPGPGYVGPSKFEAHLTKTGNPRVNGQVSIDVQGNRTAGVQIDLIRDAVATSAQLVRNTVAFCNVPVQGNPKIDISNLSGFSDFDEFLDALATGQVSASVSGTYFGNPFTVTGPFVAGNSPIIHIQP